MVEDPCTKEPQKEKIRYQMLLSLAKQSLEDLQWEMRFGAEADNDEEENVADNEEGGLEL